MLTIYATCPCGHVGTRTNEKAVNAHKACKPIRMKCDECGNRDNIKTILSINPICNALDGARTGKEQNWDG